MDVGFGLRDVANLQVLAVAGITCITPDGADLALRVLVELRLLVPLAAMSR